MAPTDSNPSRSTIIVIPGYYGTKLVQATDGTEVWIDTWEALFRHRSLRLPLPGLGFDSAIDLRPDGILKNISVIPLIYSVMGYGSLLQTLKEGLGNRGEVIPFTYDWRLDLMNAVRDLGRQVDRLRTEGKYPIAVVAHSMGGLIASYYLRYGSQDPDHPVENWEGAGKIDAVVLAGVPFLGSMTVFRNMHEGVRIGLNRSLLDQQAVSSFPASYYLLPASAADVLFTPAREPLKGMIRNDRNWKTYAWGLLKESGDLADDIVNRRFAYVSSWLRQTRRFSDLLLAPPGMPSRTPLPLLYLFAKGNPTLASGVVRRQESLKKAEQVLFSEEHFDKSDRTSDADLIFQDGDGTVTLQSSSLPTAYGYALHVTSRELHVDHAELVSDPEIQQDIVDFLAVLKIGHGKRGEQAGLSFEIEMKRKSLE